MKTPPALYTSRLHLRPWREGDLEPFRRMNSDPEVMRHFARPLTFEESDAAARRLIGFFNAGLGPWAVESPGEATFIGFVGAWPTRPELPFAPAVEVGWRVDKPFWGRGYASEGALAALDDAFARTACPEIVAYAAAGNGASIRVMQRVGMQRDSSGDFEHPLLPEGHPNRSHILYRLQRRQFESRIATARS